MANNPYHQNLTKTVVRLSASATWEGAVLEWDIADWEEDENLESSCVCGKESLRYLFTIKNTCNGNILYPIGSSCIKKFGRSELYNKVSLQEQLFKLLHAIENHEYITLTSDYFSRKLLKHLYDIGAFEPSQREGFSPRFAITDYQFLLTAFNMRKKESISERAQRKINGVISFSIKPFLRSMLKNKIKYRKK